jgi:CRISPR/Cas system-associated exonuclease Cas4 (RecB family)
MFQVVTTWNVINPLKNTDLQESIGDIRKRGYCPDTYLTGQFASEISDGEISPLSVSDVADKYCPSRRDLYFRKGRNRNHRRRRIKTWGGTAGRITQNYIFEFFSTQIQRNNTRKYTMVTKRTDRFSKDFQNAHSKDFRKLNRLSKKEYEDPKHLLKFLTFNGRIELGMKLLHSILSKNGEGIDWKDINFEHRNNHVRIYPKPIQIGISSPSTPDFLVEKYGIVGDVKSGVRFEDHYLLTCAGYALAYENWKRKERKKINWGIIYFFPTRIPTDYAKPFTFAQIYIFPIDDTLRNWFLQERDWAYNTIIKDDMPRFPEDKQHCKFCQYIATCEAMGLRDEDSLN